MKQLLTAMTIAVFGAIVAWLIPVSQPHPVTTTGILAPPFAVPAASSKNPTSNTGSEGTLCQLAEGQDCQMLNELDLALLGSQHRVYPEPDAVAVPRHAQISVKFDEAVTVDPATLSESSFYLSSDEGHVPGVVEFLAVSQLAIFSPTVRLRPDTVYSVTLAPSAQDVYGQSLPEAGSWQFTTGAEQAPIFGNLESAAAEGAMYTYFGDLHAHSGYSDGQGTPADAFAGARARGLDFFSITEHGFLLTDAEWQNL
ncbi:MAG: Ig-like domain-containing protein, partial [Anaerolineae bacterium]|nr:Ig-like domain-containing protein [Anaerolineae bacterium]